MTEKVCGTASGVNSIGRWVEKAANVENEDILLFITVGESKCDTSGSHIQIDFWCAGVTHVSRLGDFPV